MKTISLIFAGTPDFAVPALKALIDAGYDIAAVYTQPDRPAGRGQKLTSSPVKCLALAERLPLEQPETLKSADALATLKSYQADMMVVAAYGLLLPEAVLRAFPLGCINIHASLLPRWRGAAPIQRAILAGDTQTGISIMQMEKGLDTGPVYCTTTCDISAADTAQSLHDKLTHLGAQTLLQCLPHIIQGSIEPRPQSVTFATYAKKLEKHEAKIDWSQSADVIHRQVRAFNPWPVAFTVLNGETVRVWEGEVLAEKIAADPGTLVRVSKNAVDVATGKDLLRLTKIQFPGAKALPVQAVLNARQALLTPGVKFS